ncbi:Aspartate racemase [Candidatus Lokiarchaeum ossiferum]|uniref:Aspartate racemase n=1 Tax=Candidatus Lokiarchaeum ossiferum TaxID=2951803 RepID=A0ABY6HKS5_9ARCH|nr:Aspartate racemase [Candidatus Lokiarchaeum sp. B-35]
MIKTAKVLEQIGSDFILIPCNTAHFFIDKVQSSVKIPILNMIQETVNFISQNYPDVKKVGLLATTGTIKSKVYEEELRKEGIKTIIPNQEDQELLVMESIYGRMGIKSKYKKYPRKLLKKAGNNLTKSGAELIICGCTEISMLLDPKKVPYILINPSEIIAKAAVERALFESNENIIINSVSEEGIAEV